MTISCVYSTDSLWLRFRRYVSRIEKKKFWSNCQITKILINIIGYKINDNLNSQGQYYLAQLTWNSWNCPLTNLNTKDDFPTADSPKRTNLNCANLPPPALFPAPGRAACEAIFYDAGSKIKSVVHKHVTLC